MQQPPDIPSEIRRRRIELKALRWPLMGLELTGDHLGVRPHVVPETRWRFVDGEEDGRSNRTRQVDFQQADVFGGMDFSFPDEACVPAFRVRDPNTGDVIRDLASTCAAVSAYPRLPIRKHVPISSAFSFTAFPSSSCPRLHTGRTKSLTLLLTWTIMFDTV